MLVYCCKVHVLSVYMCQPHVCDAIPWQVEGQLHSLQQATAQAAEYVKRLEQTNYALSVRVQAMGNPGPNDFMGGQRPPDVF